LRLTAIVPATNRPATLEQCLAAIERAADGPDETLVIDQPAHERQGAARNRGACAASGDVLVFVDADVTVHPDAFTRVRAAFAEDARLAGLFGSYDDEPYDRALVSSFRNLLHHHVHQTSGGPAETFWTGLGAMRRDVFMAAGGFDPGSRVAQIEDVDLGMRVRALGEPIVLDPGLLGKHLKSWSLRGMVRSDIFDRGVPWVGLMLRHRSARATLNLGWRHRLSALATVAGVLALVRGRATTVGAALATLCALNLSFYSLLWRRGGPRNAAGGILLHATHHLCGVVAVPLGVLAHVRTRGRP
jgi:hypothetical protein